MNFRVLFLILIILGLITIESNAQRPTLNRDGFYRVTYNYSPQNWQLFDFYVNPYSPSYIAEVAIPDTSFISVDVLDNERSVVNSALSNPRFLYNPAIYEINWNNISDDSKLPVTNGEYLVRFKAYNNSTTKELVFSDSISVPVLNGWEFIEPELVLSFVKTYPGYFIPVSDSLVLGNDRVKKGINWQLLGGRFKDLSYDGEKDYLLSLSFEFTLDKFERAFSSFFKANDFDSPAVPFQINKRISFNSVQIVEIKLRYKDLDLFVIQQFGSDLAVLDLKKLWDHILTKK